MREGRDRLCPEELPPPGTANAPGLGPVHIRSWRETPISRFGTERPKPVTNSPERGRQSCFCHGKGSGWRKRLQAHHYRGPEVERRQRSLPRPWSFQSCLPQLSLLPGTICRGGEQQSTQPTGKGGTSSTLASQCCPHAHLVRSGDTG